MKKLYLCTSILLLSLFSFSQNKFEKGYYITNENDTVECFLSTQLKNKNPNNCKYKLTKESKIETKTIDEIKEFAVPGNFKFIRATVKMDASFVEELWVFDSNQPFLKEYTVFLQVLIEGKASLYEYTTAWEDLFLYSIGNDTIKQLIFKPYYLNDGEDGYFTNREYQRQLQTDLNCKNGQDFNIKYMYSPLIKIVTEYNTCNNTVSKEYFVKSEPVKTNIRLISGINYYESEIQTPQYTNTLPQIIAPNVSFEIESYINKHKNLSFVVQPSLIGINKLFDFYNFKGKVCLNQLAIPIGIRYYLMNKDTKIYTSLMGNPAIGINFNSYLQRFPEQFNRKIGINTTPMYMVECGVMKNKFSFSLSYSHFNVTFRSDDKLELINYSLKIGYRLN